MDERLPFIRPGSNGNVVPNQGGTAPDSDMRLSLLDHLICVGEKRRRHG